MPKSGTHLLTELLDQIEGMRFSGHVVMLTPADQLYEHDERIRELDRRARRLRSSHYLAGHLVHEEAVERVLERNATRLVTILRDPRAVVVSAKNYLYNATWMPHRDQLMTQLGDERAVLEYLVGGQPAPGEQFHVPDIGEHYRAYADWQRSDVGLTVRFEDLVGPQGGGSLAAQHDTVRRILDHLGYATDEQTVARVAGGAFSGSSITFHGGRVDAWREELPGDLIDEINARCADEIARLGYE
jgi:hypothetical protein